MELDQARRDSNPQPTDLESVALPIRSYWPSEITRYVQFGATGSRTVRECRFGDHGCQALSVPTHQTPEIQRLLVSPIGGDPPLFDLAMKGVLTQERVVLLLLHTLRHGFLILGRRVPAWWLTERAGFGALKRYDNDVSFRLFRHRTTSIANLLEHYESSPLIACQTVFGHMLLGYRHRYSRCETPFELVDLG